MQKIGVIGDYDSILGFSAVGFEVFPIQDNEEAAKVLKDIANDFSILYITEKVASQIMDDIAKYKDKPTPAIILIPSKAGSLGLGIRGVHNTVERAVGVNILTKS